MKVLICLGRYIECSLRKGLNSYVVIKCRPVYSEISLSTWSVVPPIISIDVLHLLTQHPVALRRADTWRVNGRNATRKPTHGPAHWTLKRETSPASRPRPSKKSVKKVCHFYSLFISTFGNPHSLVHSWFNFFEVYVISRLRIFLILYAFYVFLYF